MYRTVQNSWATINLFNVLLGKWGTDAVMHRDSIWGKNCSHELESRYLVWQSSFSDSLNSLRQLSVSSLQASGRIFKALLGMLAPCFIYYCSSIKLMSVQVQSKNVCRKAMMLLKTSYRSGFVKGTQISNMFFLFIFTKRKKERKQWLWKESKIIFVTYLIIVYNV